MKIMETRYFLITVHEKIGELEFSTLAPIMIQPGEEIEKEADIYLLNFYGEENGEFTTDYGEYNMDFNNDSVGFISYEEISKEDWDVISKYL